MPYNGAASSGSNQGPTNPALNEAVEGRVKALRERRRRPKPVPVDLVTASGSGLDPHISPAAAEYQIARVAKARGIAEDKPAASWCASTPKAASSASSASRASTCSRSTSRSTRRK